MAEFNVTFSGDAKFNASLKESNQMNAGFGDVIEVEHQYDPYPGTYEVIPRRRDQTLATNGKNMEDDVTVKEVPWTEVSNPTGTTYSIAAD